MKVKMIKDFITKERSKINTGQVLTIRVLRKHPLDFQPEFQVVEGKYSGEVIPYSHFVEVEEERTFTETEVKSIENMHLSKSEMQSKEIHRLKIELNNTKIIISRLTERIVITGLKQMLLEWNESTYEGTEAEDREQFAKKIFSYLSNVQQT